MSYSNQQFQQMLRELPEELREAILSINVTERFMKIAKNSGLHIDKQAELTDEVLNLLVGITKPEKFTGILVQKLGITSGAATAIAQDIDRSILSPIRDSLKKVMDGRGEEGQPEKPREEMLETKAGNFIPVRTQIADTPITPAAPTNPIPNLRTMPKDIAKIKMSESIRMPKEEIATRYGADESSSSGEKYSVDPYREAPE